MNSNESENVDAIVQKRLDNLTLDNYCLICGADLQTPQSAYAHYNSKRHKSNLAYQRVEERSIYLEERAIYLEECKKKRANENSSTNTKPEKIEEEKKLPGKQNEIPTTDQKSTSASPKKKTTSASPNKKSTHTSLQPSVIDSDKMVYFEQQMMEEDYIAIMEYLINEAARSVPDREQEKTRLELVLELQTLIRQIFSARALNMDFALKELQLLNLKLSHYNSYNMPVDSHTQPIESSSFFKNSFLNMTVIGAVTYLVYKYFK